MRPIPVLETEHGATVYINPAQVSSVQRAPDDATLAIVWMADRCSWRVKGNAKDVASLLLASEPDAGLVPVRGGEGDRPVSPDYEAAFRSLLEPLSWMRRHKRLSAYLGWNLADIANDLIDGAYPGLRDGAAKPLHPDRG